MVREAFPAARVLRSQELPEVRAGRAARRAFRRGVELVQYIGGDLLHAARVHARLKGRAATYKFSRRAYRRLFDRAFAVDAQQRRPAGGVGHAARTNRASRQSRDRRRAVRSEPARPNRERRQDGILVMPGSRAYEIENLVPFFFAVALRILRERPEMPIAFALSPFTPRGAGAQRRSSTAAIGACSAGAAGSSSERGRDFLASGRR